MQLRITLRQLSLVVLLVLSSACAGIPVAPMVAVDAAGFGVSFDLAPDDSAVRDRRKRWLPDAPDRVNEVELRVQLSPKSGSGPDELVDLEVALGGFIEKFNEGPAGKSFKIPVEKDRTGVALGDRSEWIVSGVRVRSGGLFHGVPGEERARFVPIELKFPVRPTPPPPPPPSVPIEKIRPNGGNGIVIRIVPDDSGVAGPNKEWLRDAGGKTSRIHGSITYRKNGAIQTIVLDESLDAYIDKFNQNKPGEWVDVAVESDEDGAAIGSIEDHAIESAELTVEVWHGRRSGGTTVETNTATRLVIETK